MAAGERPSSLWSRGLGWGSPSAETAQWVFVRPENSNTDWSMCVIPREEYRLSPFLQFCCPPLEKEGQRTKPKWAVFLVFILWQRQLWCLKDTKGTHCWDTGPKDQNGAPVLPLKKTCDFGEKTADSQLCSWKCVLHGNTHFDSLCTGRIPTHGWVSGMPRFQFWSFLHW